MQSNGTKTRWYRIYFFYLLSYVLILGLPLLLLGWSFINNVQQASIRLEMEREARSIKSEETLVENSILNLLKISEMIKTDPDLTFYALQNVSSDFETVRALRSYSLLSEIAEETVLYFSQTDKFYTAYTAGTGDSGILDSLFAPYTTEDLLRNNLQAFTDTGIIECEDALLLVQPLYYFTRDNYISLVFVIDYSDIKTLLSSSYIENENLHMIINREGRILISSAETAARAYDDKRFITQMQNNSLLNWDFVSVIDKKAFEFKVPGSFILELVILILIGSVLIVLSIRYFYKPIEKLRSAIDDKIYGKPQSSSLNELNTGLISYFSNADDLQDQLDNYKNNLTETVLKNLINGFITSPVQIARQLETLSIRFPHERYRVIVAPYDFDNEKKEAQNYLFECIEQEFNLYGNIMAKCCFMPHPKLIAIIINYNDENEDSLTVFTEDLAKGIQNRFNITLSFSLGPEVSDIIKLNYSFLKATGYRKTSGSQTAPVFDSARKNELLSLLKENRKDEAKALIFGILDSLKESNSKGVYSNILIKSIIEALKTDCTTGEMEQLEISILSPYLNIEEIKSLFSLYIDKINAGTITKAEDDNTAKMLAYIEQRFTDPNFTIQEMAEHFDFTYKYFCKYFKEETGLNLSDYITNKRINLFIELCKNSDKPFEEIIVSTGYDNESSFRRRFKSRENITPKQFFQLCRE